MHAFEANIHKLYLASMISQNLFIQAISVFYTRISLVLKKMLKMISKVLENLDVFSIPTFVIFKKENRISTNISKFCSICFLIYASWVYY